MEARPTAEMALRHKGVIVGIKTAHYPGPEFTPVERAVEAGTLANIPVMVDFGRAFPQKVARGAADEEAPARRHLHPRLFRPPGRAGPLGPRQPRPPRGPQARRPLRRRPRRRELHLARRRADRRGRLPPRHHLDRPAHRQHERRHEGHAERHEQVPGPGPVARRRDPPLDLEPRPRDQAGAAGPPLGRVAGGHGRAAAREGRLRLPRRLRRPPARQPEADLRDDPARREDRLRSERPRPARIGRRCPRTIGPRATPAGTAQGSGRRSPRPDDASTPDARPRRRLAGREP